MPLWFQMQDDIQEFAEREWIDEIPDILLGLQYLITI